MMAISTETHTQTYILRKSLETIDRIKERCRQRRYLQVPTNYEIIDEALKLYERYIRSQIAKEDEKRIERVNEDNREGDE
jgi:hypothetical protein